MTVEIPGWVTWLLGGGLGFAFAWGQMRMTVSALQKQVDALTASVTQLTNEVNMLHRRFARLDGREEVSGVHDVADGIPRRKP